MLVLGLATLDEAFDYEMRIAYDGHRRWHKFVYEVLEAKGARPGAIGPHGFDLSLCIAKFNPTPEMAACQREMETCPIPSASGGRWTCGWIFVRR